MGALSAYKRIARPVQRFRKQERGSILVEFGLVLPIMLLIFGLMIEGSRMLWTYQAAIAGVRDAGRYLARITPANICTTGGSLSGLTTTMKNVVEKDIGDTSLFPNKVTINSVTPSYSCTSGSYRNSPVAVATVTASMTIEYPLANIMSLFGQSMTQVTTTFSDSSRIFGQ